MEIRNIAVTLLEYNKGQVEGLPKNPRFVRDQKFELTKRSIQEAPEMLSLRELIVYPFTEDKFVVIGGNLRLRACRELGYDEVPCKVLPPDTPASKLREYAIKDNQSYGENDEDILKNEWDSGELVLWGFEPEEPKDRFKERFNAITDEDAVYPLIPKYDEHHQMFIILVESDVDANWLREQLGMQKMQSYKTGKISKSNVISFKDFRNVLAHSNPEP